MVLIFYGHSPEREDPGNKKYKTNYTKSCWRK